MKTNVDVARAWKDRDYRNSLSAEQLAALPKSPVGEITDVEAEAISGGIDWQNTKKTGIGGCDECEMK